MEKYVRRFSYLFALFISLEGNSQTINCDTLMVQDFLLSMHNYRSVSYYNYIDYVHSSNGRFQRICNKHPEIYGPNIKFLPLTEDIYLARLWLLNNLTGCYTLYSCKKNTPIIFNNTNEFNEFIKLNKLNLSDIDKSILFIITSERFNKSYEISILAKNEYSKFKEMDFFKQSILATKVKTRRCKNKCVVNLQLSYIPRTKLEIIKFYFRKGIISKFRVIEKKIPQDD